MKKIFLSTVLVLCTSFSFASVEINNEFFPPTVNNETVEQKAETIRKNLSKAIGEEVTLKVINVTIVEENGEFTCTIMYCSYARISGREIGCFTLVAPDDHPDCGGFVGIIAPIDY